MFPIDQLPIGFAPGTNEIYRKIVEREQAERTGSLTVTAEAPLTPATVVQVAVNGAARVILLAELPALLDAVAVGVLVAAVIGSAHYLFHNSPVTRRRARQLAGLRAEPETLPMPDPLPPQPPIEAGPTLPPHDGGSGTTVRLPPLPPDVAAPSLPSVLPGGDITPAGPTVMESRNSGLAGDERTTSKRARDAARKGDPKVTNLLPENEWRAHHLISMEAIRSRNPVLAAAARAGWKTDEEANIAALPTTTAAQQTLRAVGIERPVDYSGHSQWNDRVKLRLQEIEKKLDTDFGKAASPEKDRAARIAVEKLMYQLRSEIAGLQRLSENSCTDGGSDV